VDSADFSLTNTGSISGASVTGVSGSGATRTVTVGTGSGSGTIRLNVVDNNTIVDGSSNGLGGAGAGNGNFNSGQAYTIDKTAPNDPTNVQSSDHTVGSSSSDMTITMTWTAATDNSGGSGVDGYAYVFNTTAGPSCDQTKDIEENVTTVTSAALAAGSSYYFHICTRDNVGNWTSTVNVGPYPLQAAPPPGPTNTGFRNCTSASAVTTNSGDNNGFQSSAGSACADGGTIAQDDNSGTSSSTSCTSTAKDRHVFQGYGISLPAGATVNGIEVRVDGWADSTSGSPRYCIELWNGSSWVGLRQTPALSTSTASSTVLGSASDKWSVANWTPSMIANLRVRVTSVASSTSRDFRLDWVAVRVTYTP
jgi:hypothetical protein